MDTQVDIDLDLLALQRQPRSTTQYAHVRTCNVARNGPRTASPSRRWLRSGRLDTEADEALLAAPLAQFPRAGRTG